MKIRSNDCNELNSKKMCFNFNTLYTHILDTLANSEDSTEMSHGAEFHQGLHCLLKTTETEKYYYLEIINVTP